MTDTTLQRTDSLPPAAPHIHVEQVWRGQGLTYLDGGTVARLAEGSEGSVKIVISAADGSPLPDQDIGYRFHFVDGGLPKGLAELPRGAWRVDGKDWKHHTWMAITWDDGGTWKQDAFSFRMFMTAIDRAGNESKASNVVAVAHDGNCDKAFEMQRNIVPEPSMIGSEGSWEGKDEDGAKVTLTFAGHQFNLVSQGKSIEGFAQVWRDKDGKDQVVVDTGPDALLSGAYQLQGDRLHLSLRVPGAQKVYDLHRVH